MGEISDKIKEVSEEQKLKFEDDSKYKEFKQFFDEMKDKGLLNPKQYSIPPLDTVGKRLYNSDH
ncbi:hypothetical protein ACE01N_00355 [Saccharicrinis sp. FJH2]|uniref:hypothetical protein n=1 Tax=Saccharicrinis sp. FJH65 TaxID=3344659 RepID=UPI0035F371B8